MSQQQRRRSHSIRSSSSASINFGTIVQPSKHRTTADRTSESDKFDTLLMLAAERRNRLDPRQKQQQRYASASPQRKGVPLLLVEQHTSNHVPNVRSQQVRFSTSAGRFSYEE
jgi:hypothetical protein